MSTPPISKDDAAWRPLKSWIITQVHAEQRQLESIIPRSEAEHNMSRGRIHAYRSLINAVEPAALLTAEQVQEVDHYDGN